MEIVSPPLQEIHDSLFDEGGVKVMMLRLDKIHPLIHGNKYFKLKYNLQKARELKQSTLLTFGGAYSNHIYAVAAAGKIFGFNTIGIIRGDELNENSNLVLRFAKENGMQFVFVSREEYREKETEDFIQGLRDRFGSFYLVPEGGSNELAVMGAAEIPSFVNKKFDYISCACGTAGTLAGISTGLKPDQKAIGITVVNAPAYFEKQLQTLLKREDLPGNLILNHDFHLGGYAKTNDELSRFVQAFYQKHNVKLDRIYNAKLCYGMYALIKNGFFAKGDRIVIVNTGGLPE